MGTKIFGGNLPVVYKQAAPGATDVGYDLPTLWVDETNNKAYLLLSVSSGVATWQQVALADAFVYKGVIDCSSNPNYPAANAGDVYKISVAGKIGGASGIVVEAGDSIYCSVDGSAAGTQAAVGANWGLIQSNIDLVSPPVIGKSTPNEAHFSPLVAKGPAIITSFTGTVSTSGSSTSVVFSSAADAILAGYNATNPISGATLIVAGPFTRYIVSWTNSTTCVVDTAVTLGAGTTITSVQLPIFNLKNSAGVIKGWVNAAGELYLVGSNLSVDVNGNIGFGTTTFGTSAVKVLGIFAGTAPTTSPTDIVQAWVQDRQGIAGKAALHMRNEEGLSGPIAFANLTYRTVSGDTTLGLNEIGNNYLEVTATATITLPAVPNISQGTNGSLVGAVITIYSTTAAVVHVDPNAADRIVMNGTAQADGEKISCDATAGNSVTLIVDSVAGWRVLGKSGLWINGGA